MSDFQNYENFEKCQKNVFFFRIFFLKIKIFEKHILEGNG